MNSRIKKLAKGILLYATLLYLGLYATGIESIEAMGGIIFMLASFMLASLLIMCYIVFKDEDLEEYVPKFLR